MSAEEKAKTPWRADVENNQIIIGDHAIVLRGFEGVVMPIDHASPEDGYVSFVDGDLHATVEEVDA